jgi:hypothetical protein
MSALPKSLQERLMMKDERAATEMPARLPEALDLTAMISIEDQLASIIASAREVAIVGEELLREMSTAQSAESEGGIRKMRHKVILAPRLLAATQQQLSSLLAMLRNG